MTIPNGTKIQLKIGSNAIDCHVIGPSCSLRIESTTDPYITSVVRSAHVLTVKGTNWPSPTEYQIYARLKTTIVWGTQTFSAGVWTSAFDFNGGYEKIKENQYCNHSLKTD
jgi:hypothetical protein